MPLRCFERSCVGGCCRNSPQVDRLNVFFSLTPKQACPPLSPTQQTQVPTPSPAPLRPSWTVCVSVCAAVRPQFFPRALRAYTHCNRGSGRAAAAASLCLNGRPVDPICQALGSRAKQRWVLRQTKVPERSPPEQTRVSGVNFFSSKDI